MKNDCGTVKVTIEWAKATAESMMTQIKDARELLLDAEVKSVFKKNCRLNKSWLTRHGLRELQTESISDIQKERLSREYVSEYRKQNWMNPDYLMVYFEAQKLAETILRICKIPPADGIITLSLDDASSMQSWVIDKTS